MFEACALSSAIIHPSGSNNVDTDRETNKRDKAEVHDAHVFFPDQVERVECSFRFSSHNALSCLRFDVVNCVLYIRHILRYQKSVYQSSDSVTYAPGGLLLGST